MLWRAFALGGLGFFGLRYLNKRRARKHAAYADNQAHLSNSDVRDAGPEVMRDPEKDEWTKTDEELDETFPASDPPANY